MAIFLEAWDQLSSERMPGPVCAGAIPWRAIRDWVREEGFDSDWRRLLTAVIHDQDIKRAKRISSELELKRRRPKP